MKIAAGILLLAIAMMNCYRGYDSMAEEAIEQDEIIGGAAELALMIEEEGFGEEEVSPPPESKAMSNLGIWLFALAGLELIAGLLCFLGKQALCVLLIGVAELVTDVWLGLTKPFELWVVAGGVVAVIVIVASRYMVTKTPKVV